MKFLKQIIYIFIQKPACTVFLMAVLAGMIQPAGAQVTIGSGFPPAKGAFLDLKENDEENGGPTGTKGLLFPRVNLEGLYTLSPIIAGDDPDLETEKKTHIGLVVYNLTVDVERNLLKGLYAWKGDHWRKTSPNVPESDATRFLGGTVFVKLKSTTTSISTISLSRVINNGAGSYTMGNDTRANTAGGITELRGQGYTISNYAGGYFNIVFDVPFTEIYGVSTNIFDAYVSGGSIEAGLVPSPKNPGSRLDTRDNTQIVYMDNRGFRIKTGDDKGNPSNRPFTFLVIGR